MCHEGKLFLRNTVKKVIGSSFWVISLLARLHLNGFEKRELCLKNKKNVCKKKFLKPKATGMATSDTLVLSEKGCQSNDGVWELLPEDWRKGKSEGQQHNLL